MVSAIFVWFLIVLLLLPNTEVVIVNKYFRWEYNRKVLFDNIKNIFGR